MIHIAIHPKMSRTTRRYAQFAQDTLAWTLKNPAEAKDMATYAFDLSEIFNMPGHAQTHHAGLPRQADVEIGPAKAPTCEVEASLQGSCQDGYPCRPCKAPSQGAFGKAGRNGRGVGLDPLEPADLEGDQES